MTHVTLASSGTSCGYVPDKSRMTKAYLSINLDFRDTLLCALQRKLEWASAGLCLTKYTPLPLPPTRESDVDRFVVVPLGRIDCAVMGCFITIMAAHFPDERSEFACGYVGYSTGDVQKRRVSILLVMLRLKNAYRYYQNTLTHRILKPKHLRTTSDIHSVTRWLLKKIRIDATCTHTIPAISKFLNISLKLNKNTIQMLRLLCIMRFLKNEFLCTLILEIC